MERPVIVNVAGDSGVVVETELRPFGSRSGWKQDADLALLHRRFPGHCPYHLLHNLLQLHFGRHEMCTATPFSVELCRHGTHAKPVLSPAQMRADAPAEGALLLLPFGLSCRACDDDVGLVAGCAECEYLDVGEACGGCRRVWSGDHPHPATQLPQVGRPVELEGWRRAVGLELPGAGGPEKQEWSDEGEEWGEEEWEEEEEELEDEEAEYWDYAEEGEEDASWDAEGDGGSGGKGGWQAQGGPAKAGADGWGAGSWVEDRWGGWSWVVDFAAPAAASAAPALGAQAPDVAAVASSAATAAFRAVLAAEAVLAAPAAASAPGVPERVRILELELELEQLKRRRLS